MGKNLTMHNSKGIRAEPGAQNKYFWNFIVNAATETEPENVELRIEGDIVDDQDAWLYEWLGMPSASPNAFRDELAQYSGKDITVWIDSYGGSVFAAAGIYNALMEHKRCGAKITTKIDTKAMSAATIPCMAGDERLMSPGAIFMVHNPLTAASGYASDLRKAADVLDVVKETIINAYQLGTGKSRAKISAMMDDETYMDARTALKEGFTTGMLYSDNNNPEPGPLNFAFNRFTVVNSANESIKHLFALEGIGSKMIQTENKTDKGEIIVDLNEFKEKYPDIYNAAANEGKTDAVKAETERLKAFDALNGKVDPEFLSKAKYEEGATAESVLFRALKEGKMINSSYVAQVEADAKTANAVPGVASDDANPDEVPGILNKVTSIAKKALGIQEGGNK